MGYSFLSRSERGGAMHIKLYYPHSNTTSPERGDTIIDVSKQNAKEEKLQMEILELKTSQKPKLTYHVRSPLVPKA